MDIQLHTTDKSFPMFDASCCGGNCGARHHGGDGCKCKKQPRPTVLIVDDDPEFLHSLASALRAEDRCEILLADSYEQALIMLANNKVRLIVADHYLSGTSTRTGTALLERARDRYPEVSRVLMSGRPSVCQLVGATNRARPHHYLRKQMDPTLFMREILRRVLD